MAPPLLQLGGIALTFGGTPLLEGVDLSVAAGERVCLVGRNGSGKSTLLKIVAGLVEPDKGTRFLQPDATIRYLPQEPDLTGFATVADYVAAGLGPHGDGHAARYLLEQLGLTGDETRRSCRAASAPRRAGAGARARADILLPRRADQPSRSPRHRMAGARARRAPGGAHHHQP
jgi:ATP-binding cassette subfamily F protein uup